MADFWFSLLLIGLILFFSGFAGGMTTQRLLDRQRENADLRDALDRADDLADRLAKEKSGLGR